MAQENPRQIARFDGKNVFFEVMNTGFGIGKVSMNFIEYDVKKEAKNRQTKTIGLYMDMPKFLVLAQDVLSGRMVRMAQDEHKRKAEKGDKYAKAIYVDMGGMSAERAEKARKKDNAPAWFAKIPEGKAVSRQFKITPGDKIPWIFSAEVSEGEETETGLIAAKGFPVEIVRVPMTDDALKEFVLTTKTNIEAFTTATYLKNFDAWFNVNGNSSK